MSHVALTARDLWTLIPATGRSFSKQGKRKGLGDFLYSAERSCTLALLELFGMVTVEWDEPDEGQSWCVREVRHTPFGEELLEIVFNELERELFDYDGQAVEFGAWQPVLRSYFPQWVNNLTIADPKFRDGVYCFKVSLGKPWRRIAIPAQSDLDDLAECIIRAFDFDGCHLYGFQFVARDGRQVRVDHPEIHEAEKHTDQLAIGDLPLHERQSMQFQYDYGANWQFDVKLETVDPQGTQLSRPTIVESHGDAPEEYEFDDEW